LKIAVKYGYVYDVKYGYLFDKKNNFNKYIDILYHMRTSFPKSEPMNYIAKILMNSLYGRFGMDDNFPKIQIINREDYLDFKPLNF
jgi:hypothetical protein